MRLGCILLGHTLVHTSRPGRYGMVCLHCSYDASRPIPPKPAAPPSPPPRPGQLVIMKREEQFVPLPVSPTAHSHWRPHTEPADLGTIALIALEVDADPFLLGDLYEATDDGWRSEETGDQLHVDTYHWLPERELLAGLRATE